MLEKFPLTRHRFQIFVADFSLFSDSFGRILQDKLPVSCRVVFCAGYDDFFISFQNDGSKGISKKDFQQVQNGLTSILLRDGLVFLPIRVADGCVIAVLAGTDRVFQKKVDSEWLTEVIGESIRDFVLLKEARVDAQTGLLNLTNLQSLLEAGDDQELSLILLELLPKRFSYRHVHNYANRCTILLRKFTKNRPGLHYLGNSIFAFVLNEHRPYGKNDFERKLLAFLRKEGCHRVYIGSSTTHTVDLARAGEAEEGQCNLLDEAWTALCYAKKLGPFSFSNYQVLSHPEKHPLASPERALVRRLSRLWQDQHAFMLVQFGFAGGESHQDLLIPMLDRLGTSMVFGGTVYLHIPGGPEPDTLYWLQDVVTRCSEQLNGLHVFAGAGYYPHVNFTKTEIVRNCRKALLHATYYDKPSVVLFDSLSLNISGDVYFSDGNLMKAAKEYRKGLVCNDQDVNLHNSLGVTLAQMDKLKEASQSFLNGLAVAADNFMSLYNLGLLAQKVGDKAQALSYFKKAEKLNKDGETDDEFDNDLLLQLGILCCETGESRAAIAYLTRWYEKNSQALNSGRIFYYLGRAYHDIADNNKAMEYLQNGLLYDEYDARSMNLLGYVYATERQGDDIAISLCEKSVELEPSVSAYRLQLGKVYLLAGDIPKAKTHISSCLRIKKLQAEARFLMGEMYLARGELKRASTWYAKVQLNNKRAEAFAIAAEKRLQEVTNAIQQ